MPITRTTADAVAVLALELGGCILALAADYRIMAPGPYTIGLNEVLLGIPFPAAAFEVSRRGIPAAARGIGIMGTWRPQPRPRRSP